MPAVNGAPAYGNNDIIDMGNNAVRDVKGPGQLNAEIRFTFGIRCPESAVNINFGHVELHI